MKRMRQCVLPVATAILMALPQTALAGAGPEEYGWKSVVAGQNPMTAEQAAAALAYIHFLEKKCDLKIRWDDLIKDVESDGNAVADFQTGGKFHQQVGEKMDHYRHYSETAWAFACITVPYADN